MTLTSFLPYFIIIPFVGYLICLLIPGKKEDLISTAAFSAVGVHLLAAVVFSGLWLWNGHPSLNKTDIVLYETPDYSFFVDFYFDKITAVYLSSDRCLLSLLPFTVVITCTARSGYKRFFNTILFFYFWL